MPQIIIPDVLITPLARAWAETHLTPRWKGRDGVEVSGDPSEGVNTLLALAQGELIAEFELGTPEPKIEDVTTILFHTFTVGKDRQEFTLYPVGDTLELDICERRTVDGPGSGPLRGRKMSIPKDPP